MRVGTQKISFAVALFMLMSVFSWTAAYADDGHNAVADISENQSIKMQNVVDSERINGNLLVFYIKADESTTISFDGRQDYGFQNITYYPKAKLKDRNLELGQEEPLAFKKKDYAIKKDDGRYTYTSQLPEGFTGEYLMAAGNYAVLEKSGFYEVSYTIAPGAKKGKFLVKVTQTGDLTTVEPDQEPVKKPELQPAIAVSNATKVFVNGREIAIEAYNIDGNNYFKLRDLAKALYHTNKEFEVGYDTASQAISVKSDTAYTPVGGELEISGAVGEQQAVPSNSEVQLNGKTLGIGAYYINGNNYFKLRDIAKALDFRVIWSNEMNAISITSVINYFED
ncbi:hypothetical protein [Paenibacillus mesotrionivorans]|uniref:Uncharacterized protein n=1 Tax=Paenibacillus mesotrionivorans TaxID=3160968 RepID=A0ACC7NWJ0_9BACL